MVPPFRTRDLHSGHTLSTGMEMAASQTAGMDANAIQAALEVWGL